MTISNWIDLFGVIGTWLVAIVAVFGRQLTSFFVYPKLSVELADPGGELTNTLTGLLLRNAQSPQVEHRVPVSGDLRYIDLSGTITEQRVATRYYHVRLSNHGRNRFPAARQAQVVITRVEIQ
ncbi:MAG: hypothetical protein ACRETL_08215, partial [Gammaproteobacteria bacterium]